MDFSKLPPEVVAELGSLVDLFDGDIDKPETAAAIRHLAAFVASLVAASITAKNPIFGPFLGAIASKAITDAAEKFIADKTAK